MCLDLLATLIKLRAGLDLGKSVGIADPVSLYVSSSKALRQVAESVRVHYPKKKGGNDRFYERLSKITAELKSTLGTACVLYCKWSRRSLQLVHEC